MGVNISELHQFGLYEYAPNWTRLTIRFLKNRKISHGAVLNRAMEICGEQKGECQWPQIPEEYYELVLEEMM